MFPRSAWTTLLIAALLVGCGASKPPPAARTVAKPIAVHRSRGGRHRHALAAVASHLPPASLGRLPQTRQLPRASGATLTAEMQALWRAVVNDSLRPGLPAFFPLGAYLQVKAIADAQGDYQARLLADYQLDLDSAHRLVGPGARFERVIVPIGFAHWVAPGVCYNRVGYYEVPNARLVYRQGGVERSFGIASMISWRGVWFVVHLGAVVRSGATGVVDDPAVGPGVSVPSSTC